MLSPHPSLVPQSETVRLAVLEQKRNTYVQQQSTRRTKSLSNEKISEKPPEIAEDPKANAGVPKKRARGGQPGSKNALKTGRHTAERKALRKRVWLFVSGVRGALADVDSRRPKRPKGRPAEPKPPKRPRGRPAKPKLTKHPKGRPRKSLAPVIPAEQPSR